MTSFDMNQAKITIILVLIALATRLALFVAVAPWDQQVRDQRILYKDASVYHRTALDIVKHQQFSMPPVRTPLYPLFIASLYTLFGERPWIVLLAQIVIDTFSCALLFIFLTHLIDIRTGFSASLFYALDPFLILYCSQLMSEILFVFMCVTGLYFFSNATRFNFEKGASRNICLSSVSFGIATLVRPISQFVPLVFILSIILLLRRNFRKVIKLSFLHLITFVIIVAPWAIRNYVAYGSLSLSTSGAYNLLILDVMPIVMEKSNLDAESAKSALLAKANGLMSEEGLNPNEINDFEKAKYWQRVALGYIKSYPYAFLKHYSLGILRMFGSLNTSGYSHTLGLRAERFVLDMKDYPNVFASIRAFFQKKNTAELIIGAINGIYLVISYFFLTVGLLTFWRKPRKPLLVFCLLMIFYFVVLTGPAGVARFKLPTVPFYLPFIGIGAIAFLKKIKGKEGPKKHI